jgi:hypothetical protein
MAVSGTDILRKIEVLPSMSMPAPLLSKKNPINNKGIFKKRDKCLNSTFSY